MQNPDTIGVAYPVLSSESKAAGSEYDAEEVEFLRAIQAFQKRYSKRFPTFVEVLRVAKSLGYRKPEVI